MNSYKLALLNSSNKIIKYYVFTGTDSLPDMTTIFSSDELQVIQESNIELVNVNSIIHIDDTIETVKKKFLQAINMKYSFGELYMFVENMNKIYISQIYENLSYHGKMDISTAALQQYMINCNMNATYSFPMDSNVIDYNDLLQLDINGKDALQKNPLGMKLVLGDALYSMFVNPFDTRYINDIITKSVENLVSTTNRTLIMNAGFIQNNTIYVCVAEDVLKFASENSLNESIMLKLYYTYLHEDKIYDASMLMKKKESLIKNTRKMIGAKFDKNVENIDLFYNMYESDKNAVNYIYQGITRTQIVLYQENEFFIPLDVVFKIISTNETMPLTKLNVSKKRETIFRLYAPETAKGGRKVPFLSKTHVLKINKATPVSGRVTMYMKKRFGEDEVIILCELDTYANVYIHVQSKKNFDMTQIQSIIKDNVNPILNAVKNYIEQSGYKMTLFESLYDSNVEIIDMNYICYLEISKTIQLRKIIGCISSVFNVEKGNLKDGIVMRYKRVANFNEMDSIQSFISDLYNKETQEDTILSALMENFQLSEEEAKLKLIDFLNGVQVVQNMNKNRRLRAKENPGFLININQDQFSSNITIKVDGINNIRYYETLPVYLDSLIRITQSPPLKFSEEIKKLCTGRQDKAIEEFKDIIAPSEKELLENEPLSIVAQDVVFGNDAENTPGESGNVLDMLMQDDSDEESDDELLSGGDDNSPSPLSIELIQDSDNEESPEALDIMQSNEESPEALDIVQSTEESPEALDIDVMQTSEESPEALDIVQTSEESPEALDIMQSSKESPEALPTEEVDAAAVSESEASPEENIKDVSGMSLTFPNPFFKKLEKRDPKLYVSTQQGNFNAYSRSCQWNKRRQPVILTDKEKERIDKEHPGSYDQALKYGSSPDKQYWYICPRYWDMKNETSLTKEEVDSGKYGEVIDSKATEVPKDKFIFEFNDGKEHLDKDGNYVNYNPGFLKAGIHPDGLCVPCCFKTWNKPKQLERKAECLNETNTSKEKMSSDQEEINTQREIIERKPEIDEYVKGPEKFPLETGRIGYMPQPIQRFLNFDNKTCYINAKNTNLKPKTRCILRYGVESSKTRSFIACIADIFIDYNNNELLSIEGFINYIKKNILSIDSFTTYQNGSLVNSFYNPNKEVRFNEYPNSAIYKRTNLDNAYQKDALTRVVNAYNNFLDYLDNPDSPLDYMYMWDIICTPHPKLFFNGLNIVIMDIPSDDSTNNISVVCPTNHYSHALFDLKKPTLFLVKKYEYYEPLYIIEDSREGNKTQRSYERLFTYGIAENLPGINNALREFEPMFKTMCAPLNSIPEAYVFKTNVEASIIKEELEKQDYKVLKQVLNFHNKVVGLYCMKEDIEGLVPTLPSGHLQEANLEVVYFNDDSLWSNYLDTTEFLTRVSKESDGVILCKPHSKIIEDEMIVGILTETNQFIDLIAPEQDLFQDDGLKIVYSSSYTKANEKTQLSSAKDTERELYVKKIRLESGFYNAFRNTLRSLLNNYSYLSIRKSIESIANSQGVLYTYKLERIIELLHQLMDNNVIFVSFENMDFDEIFSCLNTSKDLCNERPYCRYEEDSCKLMLPINNLLNNQLNEVIYFGKLADELIRYNRIKLFIFEPKMYLSFNDLKYNLHENEIILLQSLITSDYFEDLVPEIRNSYVKYISYDYAEPYISQPYSDSYEDVAQIQEDIEEVILKDSTCIPKKKSIFGNIKDILPLDFKELFYFESSPKCSFQVFIDIMEDMNVDITINDIRNALSELYTPLLEKYAQNIADYWTQYGMKELAIIFIKKQASIEDIIASDYYGLTILDMWLLSEKYNVPLILYSATKFSENNSSLLQLRSNISTSFYIIQPAMRYSKNTRIKLIESSKGKLLLEKQDLLPEFNKLIAQSPYMSAESYLQNYKKPIRIRAKKKLIIE